MNNTERQEQESGDDKKYNNAIFKLIYSERNLRTTVIIYQFDLIIGMISVGFK